jgi:hypothetical protein
MKYRGTLLIRNISPPKGQHAGLDSPAVHVVQVVPRSSETAPPPGPPWGPRWSYCTHSPGHCIRGTPSLKCGDPGPPWPVAPVPWCNRSLCSSAETLPNIEPKAPMAPTPIQRRTCPGLCPTHIKRRGGPSRPPNARHLRGSWAREEGGE